MYPVHQHVFDAYIAADTVHGVNHIVSGLDFRKILQLGAAVLRVQTAFLLHAENIVFRQQQPALIPKTETRRQLTTDNADPPRTEQFLILDKSSVQITTLQTVSQSPRLDIAAHHHHRYLPVSQPTLQIAGQQFQISVTGRNRPVPVRSRP